MKDDPADQGALSVRLSLRIGALAALFGLLFGLYFLAVFRGTLERAADERLESSLAWMATETEVEDEDFGGTVVIALELDYVDLSVGFAPYWRAELDDGTVLCESGPLREGFRVRTRRVRLGDDLAPALTGAETRRLRGPATGGEGQYLYALPDASRSVHLLLTVGESKDVADAPWRRSLFLLLVGGGVALLLMLLGARWIIARQLMPLRRMAEEASAIHPETANAALTAPRAGRELALLHHALNDMIARLAAALSRERHFAGMAAHELRNPLIQLRLGLQVGLRRERSPEQYRMALEEALQDADRLQERVNALLMLARLGGNNIPPTEAVSVAALLEHMAAEHAFRLTVKRQGDLFISARSDLALLALRNILDNARRHAPGQPSEVSVATGEGRVTITVSDHGPGIPEDMRERIFDPLIQLDKVRTPDDEPGGYGLGLTIARAAMRTQGGDLRCLAAAPGRTGAVFQLAFNEASAAPSPDDGLELAT